MGPYGALVSFWSSAVTYSHLQKRLRLGLAVSEVLLRRKGDAPVGYFELCVKQPEGLGRPLQEEMWRCFLSRGIGLLNCCLHVQAANRVLFAAGHEQAVAAHVSDQAAAFINLLHKNLRNAPRSFVCLTA